MKLTPLVGDDTLIGGAGNDAQFGGEGRDFIVGGGGDAFSSSAYNFDWSIAA